MTYYCDHNICPMETNIPASTDTVQVNKNLHFEQIADLCNVPLDQIKSLNPQYKKHMIPGDSKPYTLRLPIDAISTFIDKQDTIYAHRADELFRNRKTVAVKEITPSTRKTTAAVAGKGKLTYYTIKVETLCQLSPESMVSQLRIYKGGMECPTPKLLQEND